MELRLMLTAACNFDCFFCLNEYWAAKDPRRELSVDQYSDLVSSALSAISARRITLTGGEPTVCRDLGQIIYKISKLPVHLTMVTNGYLLDRHMPAIGLLDELHVSFHSWDIKDWQRITRSHTKPSNVASNISAARAAHPHLNIKMNVVAGPTNSDRGSINRYIQFAVENKLKINVYRQSTVRISNISGDKQPHRDIATDWWDVALMGAAVIEETDSRTTYRLNGAAISLATTSTDGDRWSSIWVSPTGSAYVDILHSNP